MDLAGCREYMCFNWMKSSLHTKVADGCFKPRIGTEWNIDLVQVQFKGYSDILVLFQVNNFRKGLRYSTVWLSFGRKNSWLSFIFSKVIIIPGFASSCCFRWNCDIKVKSLSVDFGWRGGLWYHLVIIEWDNGVLSNKASPSQSAWFVLR